MPHAAAGGSREGPASRLTPAPTPPPTHPPTHPRACPGPPRARDPQLLISLLLLPTLIYAPLSMVSIGRFLWIRMRFTNKRISIINTSPLFKRTVEVAYKNIKDVRTGPRAFGLWGDMVGGAFRVHEREGPEGSGGCCGKCVHAALVGTYPCAVAPPCLTSCRLIEGGR
jgi:hypothetical protein